MMSTLMKISFQGMETLNDYAELEAEDGNSAKFVKSMGLVRVQGLGLRA